MRILICLFILSSLTSYRATAADPNRTRQIIEDKCHHCHGYKGEASNVIYPRLAGQNKEYIVKQLNNFKSGARKGTMNEMAAGLSEEEIIALAEYFSQQETLAYKIFEKQLSSVGQYIFQKGNIYSGVPACATCHGKNGAGTNRVPRLAGQHKQYILTQLEEFNLRKRTNDNAIMHSIASRLTELEREAVALYASGLK